MKKLIFILILIILLVPIVTVAKPFYYDYFDTLYENEEICCKSELIKENGRVTENEYHFTARGSCKEYQYSEYSEIGNEVEFNSCLDVCCIYDDTVLRVKRKSKISKQECGDINGEITKIAEDTVGNGLSDCRPEYYGEVCCEVRGEYQVSIPSFEVGDCNPLKAYTFHPKEACEQLDEICCSYFDEKSGNNKYQTMMEWRCKESYNGFSIHNSLCTSQDNSKSVKEMEKELNSSSDEEGSGSHCLFNPSRYDENHPSISFSLKLGKKIKIGDTCYQCQVAKEDLVKIKCSEDIIPVNKRYSKYYSYSTPAPEFSKFAILLIVIITILGFFYLRK